MDLGLKGRVALVTGGSEGIGKATAEILSREGVKVAICARRSDRLKKTAEEISLSTGGHVLPVKADISKVNDIRRLIGKVQDEFDQIDILVNNAGKAAAEYFEDISDKDWENDLNLKLMAAIRCSRAVIPGMKRRKWGRIINVTAIGGKQPEAKSLPSSLTRASGITLTKVLSKDYAEDNILVNTVCIGLIRSDQWKRRWKKISSNKSLEQYYEEMGKMVPMGRVGRTEEAAHVIAFLASEKASYVTGSSINLDGGKSGVP